MQDFNVLRPEGYLSDDRKTINDNFESIITDFSGTVFPTNNLFAGMKCNRIDQKRVYRLESNLLTWTLFYDYGGTEITVPKANKAVLEGDGNTISTTYLKSVPVFVGASSNANGEEGLVPAPNINASEYFLKGDGTWSPTPQLTKANLLEMIYPVGSIYMSFNPTNPGSLFGGIWAAIDAGRMLLAQGSAEWDVEYKAGSTGGEYKHALTADELAAHKHTGTVSITSDGSHTHTFNFVREYDAGGDWPGSAHYRTSQATKTTNAGGVHGHQASVNIDNSGSGTPHENMPPYVAVYMWRRTA